MKDKVETKRIKHLRLFKIRFFLTHGHRLKEGKEIEVRTVFEPIVKKGEVELTGDLDLTGP